MAPYPEEIDVFSAPHSRMKQLVDVYSEKLTCTDFKDYAAVESLLHDLHDTFCEFKSHEQIENKYIMRKLKKRLKSLSIHDAAVCNCHSDNQLSDMLALVKDGYSCTSKPEAERINFGVKLENALREFTGSFLPHMKEEEEVFQPMLMKYFEYEELKCLKEQVLEEHSKWHLYETDNEKHFFEAAEADLKIDTATQTVESNFSKLPPEVLSHIFSFLSPQELLNCSAVNRHWYNLSREPCLWKEIYPCYWAHGVWESYDYSHEERCEKFYGSNFKINQVRDEDADVDESEDNSSNDSDLNANELKTLKSIITYLLPQIGSGVQKIVLSSSRTLSSSLLRSILILCPNVTFLDVSYTSVNDTIFKGLKYYSCCLKLQHLDLSGCKAVTDLGLYRLADTMALLPSEIPDGSNELREVYLRDCHNYQRRSSGENNSGSDCLCEIEESGLMLQRNPCYPCSASRFCTAVCLWKQNGVMCHLAKLSYQCPFLQSCESLEKQYARYESPGASSILKTTGIFVGDSSSSGSSRPDIREDRSLIHLNLSGCVEISDVGLKCLKEAGILTALQYLDVSGCYFMSGPGLCSVIDSLKLLEPKNIFYCDRITDGPYPDTANGCQNLENEYRACCCRMMS
ncbi:F-box/LRR-repeat protein 5-like [Uloborus diversus]|uniref:F-box/LRR-repeat protein 5-like n=1 Tax=Uloborus diversus TaxID=327109 RepID=UPI002409FE59|nr:F-box/LRR-repeat protein 5-like [Uloborus diversus]